MRSSPYGGPPSPNPAAASPVSYRVGFGAKRRSLGHGTPSSGARRLRNFASRPRSAGPGRVPGRGGATVHDAFTDRFGHHRCGWSYLVPRWCLASIPPAGQGEAVVQRPESAAGIGLVAGDARRFAPLGPHVGGSAGDRRLPRWRLW